MINLKGIAVSFNLFFFLYWFHERLLFEHLQSICSASNGDISCYFQIGNAVLDTETEWKGQHDFLWSHSLIPDEMYQGLVTNCIATDGSLSDACVNYLEQEGKALGNINYYDIYSPL